MSVAIDCEMVGSRNKSLLAKVSIVDSSGKVLYDEYVKPTDTVTDYRESITGFTKEVLGKKDKKEFGQVQREVYNLINGKILVGISLDKDLDALELSHPEANQRDCAKYGPFMRNGQPQSLKDLARKYLRKDIQDGAHDSVTDAQTAMQLYNLFASSWK